MPRFSFAASPSCDEEAAINVATILLACRSLVTHKRLNNKFYSICRIFRPGSLDKIMSCSREIACSGLICIKGGVEMIMRQDNKKHYRQNTS